MNAVRRFIADPFARILIGVNLATWLATFVFMTAIVGETGLHAFTTANVVCTAVNVLLTVLTLARS